MLPLLFSGFKIFDTVILNIGNSRAFPERTLKEGSYYFIMHAIGLLHKKQNSSTLVVVMYMNCYYYTISIIIYGVLCALSKTCLVYGCEGLNKYIELNILLLAKGLV